MISHSASLYLPNLIFATAREYIGRALAGWRMFGAYPAMGVSRAMAARPAAGQPPTRTMMAAGSAIPSDAVQQRPLKSERSSGRSPSRALTRVHPRVMDVQYVLMMKAP